MYSCGLADILSQDETTTICTAGITLQVNMRKLILLRCFHIWLRSMFALLCFSACYFYGPFVCESKRFKQQCMHIIPAPRKLLWGGSEVWMLSHPRWMEWSELWVSFPTSACPRRGVYSRCLIFSTSRWRQPFAPTVNACKRCSKPGEVEI